MIPVIGRLRNRARVSVCALPQVRGVWLTLSQPGETLDFSDGRGRMDLREITGRIFLDTCASGSAGRARESNHGDPEWTTGCDRQHGIVPGALLWYDTAGLDESAEDLEAATRRDQRPASGLPSASSPGKR